MEQASAAETPAEKVAPEKDLGGVWVVLGVKAYKVPPLNMRSVRELMPKLEGLSQLQRGSMPSPDQMMVIAEVVHAAMKRSYPSITIEEVEDSLDLGNMTDAFNAVMSVSGLEKRREGEGEPRAAS